MISGVIGMGLIGGSIAKAASKYANILLYAFDLRPNVLSRAKEEGVIAGALDENVVKTLDTLIIALKEEDTLRTLEGICDFLKDGAVVLDVCGNKRRVTACMQRLKARRPSLHFAGVHPMAGREFSGYDASTAELFKDAFVLAVPVDGDEYALDAVRELYGKFGAKKIVVCDAEAHDEMIAYTSQLAHVVSSSYVKNPLARRSFGFYAGSFLDLTRVARLNKDMWTELFLNNRDNLLSDVDDIIFRLEEYRSALASSDAEKLSALLLEGTKIKEEIDEKR